MIEVATTIAFALLGVAALLCVVRLVRGEGLADRIVALDTLLLMVVSGLAVQAAITGEDTYLDVMVVAALLAFTGTAMVANFIERRGS
ncbi:MAG TPA: monovalent cation/H+ antiporter complex subunit F [Acidimicrobiia bacterium]|nr:monovalent cation/H+ antiporter complex subunit F [Acidimicrobiia bacterium]